jgi:SAM-dependent methyltransferase
VTLRQHEIAEAGHRILDPFSESKVRLLGEIVGAAPGTRVLDLACGKGELLSRWASWFGVTGVGVDLSEVFLAAARARAAELGVAEQVAWVHGDAGTYRPHPEASFDVACCIGATWIGGGLVGTARLLRAATRDDGWILIGEPFWHEPPPDEALEMLGMTREDHTSLAGTEERLASAGLELVELVAANLDDWDRYEAGQWVTIDGWLRAHRTEPMHDEMRTALTDWRRAYLTWGRRLLGWAVFVTRPR